MLTIAVQLLTIAVQVLNIAVKVCDNGQLWVDIGHKISNYIINHCSFQSKMNTIAMFALYCKVYAFAIEIKKDEIRARNELNSINKKKYSLLQ